MPPLPPPAPGSHCSTTTTRCHLPATTTQDNFTALHWASARGDAGVVGLLLGSHLMTEDCLNAKDDVSGGGGWWWVVAVVWALVTAVLVLVVVAVEEAAVHGCVGMSGWVGGWVSEWATWV